MRIKTNVLDILDSFPDELLVQIAYNDPEALEELCMALTLELQLLKEKTPSKTKVKKIKNIHEGIWLSRIPFVYLHIR